MRGILLVIYQILGFFFLPSNPTLELQLWVITCDKEKRFLLMGQKAKIAFGQVSGNKKGSDRSLAPP